MIGLFFTENYSFEAEPEENQTSFSHSTYGMITADVIHLDDLIFAYSVAVVFSNDSSSDSCAVLLVNSFGYLLTITRFINQYAASDVFMSFKLFLLGQVKFSI